MQKLLELSQTLAEGWSTGQIRIVFLGVDTDKGAE